MKNEIIEFTPDHTFRAPREMQQAIHHLLYYLGISPKYVGFHQLSYALELTTCEPERLSLVTKWLYPDVARHFQTSFAVVERNLRSVVSLSWSLRPDAFPALYGIHLEHKPSTSDFLSLLTAYLLMDHSA